MCTGLEVAGIAAALSAAGAGAGAYAQNQQLRSQDRAAAAGIRANEALQRQGEANVNQTVQKLSASQSQANTQAASAKQLAAYRAALQAGTSAPGGTQAPVAGASKAYAARAAQSGQSANDFVSALAQSGATTEGTQLERVGEGQTIADTAGKLGLLANKAGGQDYLTQLKIRSTQANPWIEAAGMLLQGAGSGAATYAGYNGSKKVPAGAGATTVAASGSP